MSIAGEVEDAFGALATGPVTWRIERERLTLSDDHGQSFVFVYDARGPFREGQHVLIAGRAGGAHYRFSASGPVRNAVGVRHGFGIDLEARPGPGMQWWDTGSVAPDDPRWPMNVLLMSTAGDRERDVLAGGVAPIGTTRVLYAPKDRAPVELQLFDVASFPGRPFFGILAQRTTGDRFRAVDGAGKTLASCGIDDDYVGLLICEAPSTRTSPPS